MEYNAVETLLFAEHWDGFQPTYMYLALLEVFCRLCIKPVLLKPGM